MRNCYTQDTNEMKKKLKKSTLNDTIDTELICIEKNEIRRSYLFKANKQYEEI